MQNKVQLTERDFFKEPFSRDEIVGLLKGSSAVDMFSFKSPSFKKLGMKPESLGEDELIDMMAGEPRLIRRPVVKIGTRVYFGADVKTLAAILKK